MECEYFCPPAQAAEHYERWRQERLNWYIGLGIRAEHLRLREHEQEELAHYSTGTTDVEYLYPWGWGELEGIANRTDFDLRQHSQHSGKDLSYQDDLTGERYIPYVIEPAAGADRATLAYLLDSYAEEPDKEGTRVVLRLDKRLAPIKVAVLPLSKKDALNDVAHEVHRLLMPHWMTQYDETQSIGRRYRRQDEIGTPYCVTVDFETLEDRAVTVRDRDSMEQIRVPIESLVGALKERLVGV
jgi:glycyl-tRNA synthetase